MKIVKKNINDLKFHPMNEQIYGANEDISELKEDIRNSGDVMTFVITPDNVIISGHRRVKACRELVAEGDERFNEVNCEIREFSSKDEEISYLIRCNHNREKTREQKARESEKLLEVEKALAIERKKSGVKIDLVATLPQGSDKKGKSREITAETVGFESGRELERSLLAVKKIDELIEQGRMDDAQLIRNELNNGTASAAEKLVKHIDELSDEDKQDIIQKKVSVNKVTSKTAVKKMKAKPTTIATSNDITNKSEIEFLPPDTSKFTSIQSLFSGLEDRTITLTLYANPKNCTEFDNILSCFKEWFTYTLLCNKENLIEYIKNDIKCGTYGAVYDLISCFEEYVDLAKPLYQVDIDKTIRENKAKDERRRQQDEIAKQKRLEEKDRVWRESMEKSRKFSQTMHETEYKNKVLNQDDSGEEW